MFAMNLLSLLNKNPALISAWTRFGQLPESRIAQIMNLYQSVGNPETSSSLGAGLLKNICDNPNFLEWLLRMAERLSDRSLDAFFQNMIVNEMLEGQKIRNAFLAEEGFEPPVTIVINPTMACNLQCTGCYSYKMPRAGMDYDLLSKVLREARDMGTRFITVSGGEPLIYKHFFQMLADFPDLQFMTYTNATLIDEAMADRIAAAGNMMPAISVEGYAEQTDERRGPGVHEKVLQGMRFLKERGVLFGFSATPTRLNSDILASDAFVDYYLEQGALFGWMFQYIPVGKDPDLSLMSTPEQRERLLEATKRWQATRPLFIGDFWNDGPCVGGCLSANRYCYITPEGKVQPCTFVHFYTHDLNSCSLMDVFRSPFFKNIRGHQPYNRNLLRPCKIIDNPEVLREAVRESGAKPSYPGAETIIEDSLVRAHLDQYAKEWKKIADEKWKTSNYEEGNSVLAPFIGRINANERFYVMKLSAEERMQREQFGGTAKRLVANVSAQELRQRRPSA